jgi:hypothetical protein
VALDLPGAVRMRVENSGQRSRTFGDFEVTNEAGSEVFNLFNLRSFLFLKDQRWRLLQRFGGRL